MTRINLLPREILERRKYERYYPWVIIFGIVVFTIVFLAWAILGLQVGARNRSLQQDQETATQLEQQAQAFAVFEKKEEELTARKETVEFALKGRVRWGRIVNELSLVLPSEVWLTQLDGLQSTDNGPYDSETGEYVGFPASMTLTGQTPDTDASASNEGYKSLAKTLVRLNDLPSLYNVWLSEATVGEYPTNPATDEIPVTTQKFVMTNSVVVPGAKPADTTGNTAAPAPPSTPGP